MIQHLCILCTLLFFAVPTEAQETKLRTLNKHSARTVDGDKISDIPCTDSLVRLLIASAREAGDHQIWEPANDEIDPKKFIAFKTKAFGPYKAHLGSKGFTGIRSIMVEIEKPHRVWIDNAGETFLSKLPEDSDMLHANRALWQTSMALQK